MFAFSKQTFSFDQSLSNELKFFLQSNQSCNRAHNVLEKFLLSNVQTTNAKHFLSSFVSDYFVPFCKSVLKQIHINGWCAYRIVKLKNKIKVPKIIASEFLQVLLEKNDETFEYSFLITDLQYNELPDVKILIFDEIENYANNSVIKSIMSGLLNDLRYENQMRAFSIQADYVRSNPTVFLQGNADEVENNRNEASTILNRNFNFQLGNLSSGNSMSARIARASTANIEVLEKASSSMASNVEFHANQMEELARRDSKRHRNLGLGFAPQYLNNVYIVPPGLSMPFQPHLPQSRQDYVQNDRLLSSKVAQGFGIPDSMLGLHVRSTYRETNSAQQEKLSPVNAVTFQSTLEKYTGFFKKTFVEIYSNIYGTILKEDVIEFNLPELWIEITEQLESENNLNTEEKNIKKKRKLNNEDNENQDE